MSVVKTTYVIEVDDKSGKVKIDGLTKGFVKADEAAKKLNNTLAKTTSNSGQMANKTGLAGAAVVEMGRTISDANFGMTAMANNLQQLSTLMVTLIATSGGVANGFKLIKQALLGPLGIIIIFQTLFTLFERVAINAKKVKKEVMETKELSSDILELNELNLDAERKRLKISKKLTDERVKELLAQQGALEAERLMLEIRLEQLSVSDDIKNKIADFFGTASKSSSDSSGTQTALDKTIAKLKEINDLLSGKGDDDGSVEKGRKGEKQKKARILTQAEIDTFELQAAGDRLKKMANMEAEEAAMIKLNSDFRMKIREEEARHAQIMTNSIIDGLYAMGTIAGEETAAGKSLAVAGALIDTYAAISGQLKAFAGVPIPGYAVAQAIATGLVGFAQVRKILSVNVPGGGGSGGNSVAAPDTIIQPNFNVVGSSNLSELQGAVVTGLGKPIRAFVTTKDMQSAEELDRNTKGGATIG